MFLLRSDKILDMFNIKPDRRVVEVNINFNVSGIIRWLESGAKSEDIDKIDRDWGDDRIQQYIIDMIPIGKTNNAYYHRNKGLISQNLAGIDYLSSADENLKVHVKKQGVESLEWSIWKGCLHLIVQVDGQRKIISATPSLIEVVELETKGKITNGYANLKDDDVKISVPILDEEGNSKDFIDTWKWYGFLGNSSVSYGNALGRVSFSVPIYSSVEY